MTFGSLFAGVGGFDLGLEAAGMKGQWQVEIDRYCQAVLTKHWPAVRRHNDVLTFPPAGTNIDDWKTDLIAAGFPCQDLSVCAKGSHHGILGEKSRLVVEAARVADLLRPRWVLLENVVGLKKYKAVLEELFPHWKLEYGEIDYSLFSTFTRRKRAFVVGHPPDGGSVPVFDLTEIVRQTSASGGCEDVLPMCLPWKGGLSLERLGSCLVATTETDTAGMRTSNGIPGQLDADPRSDAHRWLAVGNAVAPPVSKWIGERIMKVEAACEAFLSPRPAVIISSAEVALSTDIESLDTKNSFV